MILSHKCRCINIEAHCVVLRNDQYLDVTPDFDGLAAKFFVPDPEISLDNFKWLGNIKGYSVNGKLHELIPGDSDTSIIIAPAITASGCQALECGLACCPKDLPIDRGIVPRTIAIMHSEENVTGYKNQQRKAEAARKGQ